MNMLLDIRKTKIIEQMKKYLLTLVTGILFTNTIHSQVGVNNAAPKSTLDISGVVATTVPDGMLVPRFTTAELAGKDAAYGSAQNGTLVFVTSGMGIPNSKTSDITGTGFYYYDHPALKWKVIGGASSEIFNVTAEQAGNYTVTADDNYVALNINSPGYVLTLPTSGIPIGKIVYVSNIGANGIRVDPKPRNGSYTEVQSKSSGALVYLGGTGDGSWDWALGL
jgi:hypothetical protein